MVSIYILYQACSAEYAPEPKKASEPGPPPAPKKPAGGPGGSPQQGQQQRPAPAALSAYAGAVTGSRSDTPAVKGLSEGQYVARGPLRHD